MTAPSFALTSTATVSTDKAERYAKQLVAHLGRKVPFNVEGPTATAAIGGGTGAVTSGDGVLILAASASDVESLAVVQDVLGRHLERFGQRDELRVSWSAAARS